MDQDAQRDVQRQHSRSHACSFVKSAVPNACVCLMGLMATSKLVLATMNGRLKEEAPNALEFRTPSLIYANKIKPLLLLSLLLSFPPKVFTKLHIYPSFCISLPNVLLLNLCVNFQVINQNSSPN